MGGVLVVWGRLSAGAETQHRPADCRSGAAGPPLRAAGPRGGISERSGEKTPAGGRQRDKVRERERE